MKKHFILGLAAVMFFAAACGDDDQAAPRIEDGQWVTSETIEAGVREDVDLENDAFVILKFADAKVLITSVDSKARGGKGVQECNTSLDYAIAAPSTNEEGDELASPEDAAEDSAAPEGGKTVVENAEQASDDG